MPTECSKKILFSVGDHGGFIPKKPIIVSHKTHDGGPDGVDFTFITGSYRVKCWRD